MTGDRRPPPAKTHTLEVTKFVDGEPRQRMHIDVKGLRLIGQGVFSNVYRGTLVRPTSKPFDIAIKKVWTELTAPSFEFIFLTGTLRRPHPNLQQMLYAFSHQHKADPDCRHYRTRRRSDYILCESYIFEFMPDTLESYIHRTHPIPAMDLRLYTWQLYNGIKYLDELSVCHRDLKPANILIDDSRGLLRICDMGSAKVMRAETISLAYQVTRFYRPPELLLGATHYGTLIDVWSAGCIVGEMIVGKPIFPGRSSQHQLDLILHVIGQPTVSDMRAMNVSPTCLPIPLMTPKEELTAATKIFKTLDSEQRHFLNQVLVYNPRDRLHGKDLLRDTFFREMWRSGASRPNGTPIKEVITHSIRHRAEKGEDPVLCKKYAARMGNLSTNNEFGWMKDRLNGENVDESPPTRDEQRNKANRWTEDMKGHHTAKHKKPTELVSPSTDDGKKRHRRHR